MKIKNIKYTKKDGESSTRVVMPISTRDTYEDCIDLSKLDKKEIEEVLDAQIKYEIALAKVSKKAFRRFSLDGVEVVNEDYFDVNKPEEFVSKFSNFDIERFANK